MGSRRERKPREKRQGSQSLALRVEIPLHSGSSQELPSKDNEGALGGSWGPGWGSHSLAHSACSSERGNPPPQCSWGFLRALAGELLVSGEYQNFPEEPGGLQSMGSRRVGQD